MFTLIVILGIGLIIFTFSIIRLGNEVGGAYVTGFVGLFLIVFITFALTTNGTRKATLKRLLIDEKVNIVIDNVGKINYEMKDSTFVNTFEYLNNGY